MTPATTTFTINGRQADFTTGATQSLAPGETSTEIQITQETATGGADYNLFTSTTIQLTSSSSTGKFVNSAGTQTILQSPSETCQILQATFYYLDSSPGTPTLTGYAGGFTSATTVFTIYSPTLNHFTVTSSGHTQETGTAFTITITAIRSERQYLSPATQAPNTLTASAGTISPQVPQMGLQMVSGQVQ